MSAALLPEPLELDPFGYFPGVASRVRGLGGTGPGYDPAYVFHSHYVDAGVGPARFVLSLPGLRRATGALLVRIHMLPPEPGAHARLVTTERLPLVRFDGDGRVSLPFEAHGGMTYAAFCTISDDGDAEADALLVRLDRGTTAPLRPLAAATAPVVLRPQRPERYRPTGRLLCDTPPSFADPVSQPATAAQLRERPFAATLARLGLPATSGIEAWPAAFGLHALEVHGALVPGARGVLLGECRPILRKPLEDAGIRLLEDGWGTADFVLGGQVEGAALVPLVRERFYMLRPGGVALNLLALRRGDPAPAAVTRGEIERCALEIISRGGRVAQLRFGGEPRDTPVPFGLLMWRNALA